MATKVSKPALHTSEEWRAERARIEAELARVNAAIAGEFERRKLLTVSAYEGDASAEREFNTSFEQDTRMRREVEKLTTLLAHATDRIRASETQEREEVERIRLGKLKAAQSTMLAEALRIDRAVSGLEKALTDYDAAVEIVRSFGGNTPKHRAILGGALRFNEVIGDRLRREWPTMHSTSAEELTRVFITSPSPPEDVI